MTTLHGASVSMSAAEPAARRVAGRVALEWRRPVGIAVGVGAQLIFLWTVGELFCFLSVPRVSDDAPFLLRDGLLCLQFSIGHSLLLYPPAQMWLTRWIPKSLYGSVYCIITCLTLLALIRFWVTSPDVVYQLTGAAAVAVEWGFYASWAALVYSLYLTGLGYHTGLTPWWHWLRRVKSPVRSFQERQVYSVFRHPVYLAFLGLIWLQTRMTLDQLVLTGTWTVYILIGSYLKDERMARYVGEPYRAYQRRVPGFPLVVRNIGVPDPPRHHAAARWPRTSSANACSRKAA